jgi:hypothetical protein
MKICGAYEGKKCSGFIDGYKLKCKFAEYHQTCNHSNDRRRYDHDNGIAWHCTNGHSVTCIDGYKIPDEIFKI